MLYLAALSGIVVSQAAIPQTTFVDNVLRWLPHDVETFGFQNGKPTGGWLDNAMLGVDVEPAKGRFPAFFAMRKPQYPKAVGVGHFEFVAGFKYSVKQNADFSKNLPKSKLPKKFSGGYLGLTWKDTTPAAEWEYFTVQVGEWTFLSSSLDMLEDVLDRKRTMAIRVALPPSLPEWKHIDKSSRLFFVRHVVRLEEHKLWGINMGDTERIGYAVQVNNDQSYQVVAMTANKQGRAIAKSLWTYEGAKPKITAIDASTTKYHYSSKEAMKAPINLISLMALGIIFAI